MSKATLYLIDGSAYIYRNYHAIRKLSNSRGQSTNAIFGFTRTVMKFAEDYQPEYAALLFDAKGPTFRHEIYEEYKANRPPMPEDLSSQLAYIYKVSKALGFSILKMQGWEADDLAGTLAEQAKKAGFKVVFVTGDKDFLQLVDKDASIFDPMKDLWTDEKTLERDFGFKADGIIEMMALSGDSSDNIPGVPGIGPKTATKLILEYKNLENLYENISEIKGKKLCENLINNKDKAFLSRELASISKKAPLNFSAEEWLKKEADKEELFEIFQELEFKQLLEQIKKEGQHDEKTQEITKDYQAVFSESKLKKIVEDIQKEKIMAFDTESTGFDPYNAELVGISLSWQKDQAVYIPIQHKDKDFAEQLSIERVREILNPLFKDKSIVKVAHNLKYDMALLLSHDFTLEGEFKDTFIASYLTDPERRSHGLDALSLDFFSYNKLSYEETLGKKGLGFQEAPFEKGVRYACEDADYTLALWYELKKELEGKRLVELFENLEIPLIPVLMQMEKRGIRIDKDKLKESSFKIEKELKLLEEDIYRLAGEDFNINSSQQLGHILFEVLKLPVQKKTKKKTAYSTDVSVLEVLAPKHPLPEKILRHRSLSKLKNTYIDALGELLNPETKRIHTNFNQGVTATGRLSSSNPNLQNIPIRTEEGREIRKAFIPEDGWLMMAADYSQIELRLLAHYAEDKILIEAFNNQEDVHKRTASEIFQVFPELVSEELRRQAKTINFGIIYGMGAFRLAGELGISQKMAQKYIENYFERYSGVKNFIEKTIEDARKKGFTSTLFNRIRYLRDINSRNYQLRQMAERIAVNTPIQGSAADILKKAMIDIDRALKKEKMQTRMLLTVHDELVFETPENEAETAAGIVRELMEGVCTLKLPLLVNLAFGENWAEAH